MDLQTIGFAAYETLLSVIFGLLTVLVIYKVLNKLVLRTNIGEQLKQGNIAVGIFAGTLTVCVLLLVQSSVLPAVDALRAMVLGQAEFRWGMLLVSLGYFLLFYLVALVISLLVILATMALYMKATRRTDEVQELKNNNIGLAVMLSLIVLGMLLFVQPAVGRLIHSFVNYETLSQPADPPPAEPDRGATVSPPPEIVPEPPATP